MLNASHGTRAEQPTLIPTIYCACVLCVKDLASKSGAIFKRRGVEASEVPFLFTVEARSLSAHIRAQTLAH